MALVLKTSERDERSVGSNPTASAIHPLFKPGQLAQKRFS